MRAQKILIRAAIIFFVMCIIFLGIDIFKTLKISIDFNKMQSTDRIASSSNAPEIKYEPTRYVILNKEEFLEDVKKITIELKSEYINSKEKKKMFEIANIHKIEGFFYTYELYTVVKYKLLNLVEEFPKLYSNIRNYNDNQLEEYFNTNASYIEKYYGITLDSEFVEFAKSLNFLENEKITNAIVDVETIDFDYENDTLKFKIKLKTNNDKNISYLIKAEYYRSSDNQVKPYIKVLK